MTTLTQRAEALREALYYRTDKDEIAIRQAAQTLLRVMENFPDEQEIMNMGAAAEHFTHYDNGFNACRAEILKLMEPQ